MTSKPLTARRITAVLKKAGHSRREKHTTSIRGWHRWSQGFEVREAGANFLVSYRRSSDDARQTDDEYIEWAKPIIAHMAEALKAAGIEASVSLLGAELIVPRV